MPSVTTDATNSPDLLERDEEALYNMSMDELEKLALSGDLEQPEGDEPEDSHDEPEEEEGPEVDEPADGDEEVEETENTDDTQEEVDEAEEEDDSTADATESTEEEDQSESASTDEADNPKQEEFEINAVGTTVKFTLDELKEFASKGLDYTKKMHEISPWRKQIAAMADNGVSQEDINMLIDLKKGNKDAILDLVKQNGIDPLEIDLESTKYVPNRYEQSDSYLDVKETVTRLANSEPEVYSRTEVTSCMVRPYKM